MITIKFIKFNKGFPIKKSFNIKNPHLDNKMIPIKLIFNGKEYTIKEDKR